MAYMSQELKKQLAPQIKKICKEYGVKATLAVLHHSTLVLNISKSNIDFDLDGRTYEQVNVYHINSHYKGVAKEFLSKVHDAMMVGNHDNSDLMSDYFDVGWYTDINIGRWNKPYTLEK